MPVTSQDVLHPRTVDPNSLGDLESLRAQLARSNEQIMAMSSALRSIGTDLAMLVVAHVEGNAEILVRELDRIAERHVVVIGDNTGKQVH